MLGKTLKVEPSYNNSKHLPCNRNILHFFLVHSGGVSFSWAHLVARVLEVPTVCNFWSRQQKKHQQTRPWVGNSGNTLLRDEALGVLGKKIPSHVCQKGGTVVQRGLLLLPYTLGYVRDCLCTSKAATTYSQGHFSRPYGDCCRGVTA